MPTGPDLGTRIRRARERKRWTQRHLADALGVNVKSVDNWENGRTSPRSSLGAIEAVLGISLDGDGEAATVIPPRLRRAVLEELDDPEDQRRVIGLLERTLTRGRSGGPGEAESGEEEQLPG